MAISLPGYRNVQVFLNQRIVGIRKPGWHQLGKLFHQKSGNVLKLAGSALRDKWPTRMLSRSLQQEFPEQLPPFQAKSNAHRL